MSRSIRAALAASIFTCGLGGVALAAPSTLQLIIGGEAYDGPPRFEVSFDGKPLGEAAVEAAIDTGSVGRFADAADKAAHVQSFSFEIPEEMFKPGAEVRVRLTNEAYGGEGSNRDRNLYLAAVAVNGRAVTLSGLSTRGTSAAVSNEVLGEFLVLRDGNMEGVSKPPSGGWPAPEAMAATAVAPPAEVIAARAEAAPVRVPEEPPQTAGLDPDPEGCNRDELYNVVGFNENSNDITPRLAERLDQIIADIGPAKCRILVTGYSSRQGAHATNALFAIERAQNVLAYLRQNGLSFSKASAAGGGATAQFGDKFSANRRVVISVTP